MLKVLVADDNKVDLMVLSSIVTKEGYDVIQAVDGVDAIEQYDAHAPDMVLLDALMPGKDGFEVARHIKSASGDRFVPIIFLTSLTEAEDLARCIEAGGDDFLSKPYNRIILRAKLASFERMASMHGTIVEQRDQISRQNLHLVSEQEAAKAVFDRVAHPGALDIECIKHLVSPLAVFNGDVLLASFNPGGDLHLLIGDFTGHGLAAAIGAIPLSEIFYGMTRKGFSVAEILKEMNNKLGGILPTGYFCCVGLVALNFSKRTLEYWNGGIPTMYLWRHGGTVDELASYNLPLGILGPNNFESATRVVEMAVGDRLLAATDGVIEARNPEGELFGPERIVAILENADGACFERIRDGVAQHMGGEARDDDITLVEATMLETVVSSIPETPLVSAGNGADEWNLSYEVGTRSLGTYNPLPLLQHVLMELPQLRAHSVALYTVLSELYSNALEHGVLGLDSALKNSPEGFASYYQARTDALATVEGFVRIEFEFEAHGESGSLRIRVSDSGKGFDYESLQANDNNPNYHGRGIVLLRKLCTSLNYSGSGNTVEALFEW